MAQNKGLLPLLIEIDSLAIFHILSNPNSFVTYVYSLLEDCKCLMQLLGNPFIRHVHKEANIMIDWLAKNSLSLSCEFLLYE